MPIRRLLGAFLLTAALTAIGLVAVHDAAGSTLTGSPWASAASTPGPTPSTPDMSPYPPTAPADLAARATSVSVTLTWTASTPGCCGIEGYEISYARAFDDVVRLATVGNVTTATITSGIQSGAQYSFRVSARDVVGHRSNSSGSVTVVTPVTDTGPDVTPPAAPTRLTAGEPTPAGVTLTWQPSTDDVGVTGYQVYWFDGWFSSRLLATVTGTSYPAPLPAARNQYYVRARDAVGNVSIATPAVTVPTTTTTPPTSEPPPPPGCAVTYTRTSQWTHGFTANVTVRNTGDAAIDGWTLGYTFGGDQRISYAWSSTYTQSGAAVTMRNADWNGRLAPGASTTIGMQGTWTADNTAPAAFTLNDRPCAAG